MITIWLLSDCYVVNKWSLCGFYVVTKWSPCGNYVVTDLYSHSQSSQRSRASKMMEMASVTKSQGSCDVWSRAKERGTTIKTVDNFVAWLTTVHKVCEGGGVRH